MSARFWTNTEIRVLREHYPVGGLDACLQHLRRSRLAIYQMAQIKLRLRAPGGRPGAYRIYDSDEHTDAAIRTTYCKPTGRGEINALAARLGRPRWWITKRASWLGFVSPRLKQPDWTDDEIEIMMRSAHRHPKTIQAHLKRAGYARSETAITVKLKRQGGVRLARLTNGRYTATSLAQVMGVDNHCVLQWIAKQWLAARRRSTARTEQQGGDPWEITEPAVRRFIIENTHAVDIRKCDKFWLVDLLTGKTQ